MTNRGVLNLDQSCPGEFLQLGQKLFYPLGCLDKLDLYRQILCKLHKSGSVDVVIRSEASNAVDAPADQSTGKKTKPPRRQHIFIAVHRHANDLYFKRMQREQYLLLTSLRDGATVQKACRIALKDADPKIDWPPRIQAWFKNWTELGWFCKKV